MTCRSSTVALLGSVLAGVLVSPAAALGDDDASAAPGTMNLSYTGDGVTPTVHQLAKTQDHSVAAVKYGAEVGQKGDASYGIPLMLPPALHAPAVSLAYNSSAGIGSLGRGWSVSAGLTLRRATGQAAAMAYANELDPHLLSNGALLSIGISEEGVSGEWTYQSSSPGHALVSHEQDADSEAFELEMGGVTTRLEPRSDLPAGLDPVLFQTAVSHDRQGNLVEYTYEGNRLVQIDYGGRSASGDPLQLEDDSLHNVRVRFIYDDTGDVFPIQYDTSEGVLLPWQHRLDEVQVLTHSGSSSDIQTQTGTVRVFDLQYTYELDYADSEEPLLEAVRIVDAAGTEFPVADFSYTAEDELGLTAGGAPPAMPLSRSQARYQTVDVSESNQYSSLMDLSGDGLVDVFNWEDGRECAWNLVDRDALSSSWETVPTPLDLPAELSLMESLEASVSTEYWKNAMGRYTTSRVMDIDSDGHPDVVMSTTSTLPMSTNGDSDTWDTNLNLDGSNSWQVAFGTDDGFEAPIEVPAPVAFPGVSNNPSLLEDTSDQWEGEYDFVGGVVDLMDIDADGWPDVVYIVGTTLSVYFHSGSRTGGWESSGTVVWSGFPLVDSLEKSVGDVTTNEHHLRTNLYQESVPVIDKMRKVAGFLDLNADGLSDFVDAEGCDEDVVCWNVYFGIPGGFHSEAVIWPAPVSYLSHTDEGSPSSKVFPGSKPGAAAGLLEGVSVANHWGAIDGLDEVSLGTTGPWAQGEVPTVDTTPSHESAGSPSMMLSSVVDYDGDGRADFVDLEGRLWYRNLGDGFGEARSVDDVFPDAFSSSMSAQIAAVINSSPVWPYDDDVASSATSTYEQYRVSDVNGDGLLDVLDMENGTSLYSTATRPNLLSGIRLGTGAQTALSYVPMSTMDPLGTSMGPHEARASGSVVDQLLVIDPVTEQSAAVVYSYADPVCIDGVCQGFAERTRTHFGHLSGGSRPLLGSDLTAFELSRDHQLPSYTAHYEGNLSDGSASDELELRHEAWLEYDARGWLEYRLTRTTAGTIQEVEQQTTYDAYGNVVELLHYGPGVDDVAISMTYAQTADGALSVPISHETVDLGSNLTETVIESAEFYYDGHSDHGVVDDGLFTEQLVCAGPLSNICEDVLTWNFSYNARGSISETVGPDGGVETVSSWAWGGLVPTEVEDAAGHTTLSGVDELGRVSWSEDPNGVQTRTVYDVLGRSLEVYLTGAGAAGSTRLIERRTYEESAVPHVVQVDRHHYDAASPSTAQVATAYEVLDGFGGMALHWRPDEDGTGFFVESTLRDLAGSPLQAWAPYRYRGDFPSSSRGLHHGATMETGAWVRDVFGNVHSQYSAASGTVETSRVAADTWQTLDDEGYIHQTVKDSLGRIVEVWQGCDPSLATSAVSSCEAQSSGGALTQTAAYGYDGRGRVVSFTDMDGNTYTYDFDAAGRMRQVWRQLSDEAAPKAWYAYTWSGLHPQSLHEGTEEDTAVIKWQHDQLGRMTEKEVLDRSQSGTVYSTYAWTYDTDWKGSLAQTSGPFGQVDYAYEAGAFGSLGQLTSKVRTSNTGHVLSFSWTHHLDGTIDTTTWPSGAQVQDAYSSSRWKTGQRVSDASGSPKLEVDYTYGEYGELQSWYGSAGAGAGADMGGTWVRSIPGQVQRYTVAGNSTYSVCYEYSANGLLSARQLVNSEQCVVTDGQSSDRWSYGYDSLMRIHRHTLGSANGVAVPVGTAGKVKDLVSETFTYAGLWPSQIVRVDAQGKEERLSYGYDLSGGSIDVADGTGTTVLSLDEQGRMLQIGREQDVRDHVYDGAGRLQRIDAHVSATDSWTTMLYYDGSDQLVSEQTTGSEERSVVHFDGYRRADGVVSEPILPMVRLVDGALVWSLIEPDGHAAVTFDDAGDVQTTELPGVFGSPVQRVVLSGGPEWNEVDGQHGSQPDWINGINPRGVRHHRLADGLWLQPEPLLYLGPANADLSNPLGFGPVYAAGNTNTFADPSGFNSIEHSKPTDQPALLSSSEITAQEVKSLSAPSSHSITSLDAKVDPDFKLDAATGPHPGLVLGAGVTAVAAAPVAAAAVAAAVPATVREAVRQVGSAGSVMMRRTVEYVGATRGRRAVATGVINGSVEASAEMVRNVDNGQPVTENVPKELFKGTLKGAAGGAMSRSLKSASGWLGVLAVETGANHTTDAVFTE